MKTKEIETSAGTLNLPKQHTKRTKKDLVDAVKQYRHDAEQGDADAQTAINRLENSADNSDDKNCNNCLVVTTGSLPYKEYDFDDFLRTKVKDVCTPSENIDIIIIGKEFNPTILNEQVNLRIGKSLFVYSQEMFLSRLAGKDPYDDKHALMKFAEGHPVFGFLNIFFVDWPTTHIVPSSNELIIVEPDADEGVLENNGYEVGRTGKRREERRRILAKVFTTKLNNVNSLQYMKQWDNPSSGKRLQKLANTIAFLARIVKSKNNPCFQRAIDEWEEDLAWLKKTYYSGRFNFDWPSTIRKIN